MFLFSGGGGSIQCSRRLFIQFQPAVKLLFTAILSLPVHPPSECTRNEKESILRSIQRVATASPPRSVPVLVLSFAFSAPRCFLESCHSVVCDCRCPRRRGIEYDYILFSRRWMLMKNWLYCSSVHRPLYSTSSKSHPTKVYKTYLDLWFNLIVT